MSQATQMEQPAHDVQTQVISYPENYMGYFTPEMSSNQHAQGFIPAQNMCYYEGSYMAQRGDYLNATCYQMGLVDGQNHDMQPYMDARMTPMAGYSPQMLYGPLDTTYCQPGNQMFYGMSKQTATQMVDGVKGDFDDDARTFTECSTAATTPNLEHCANPENIDDGFDLGYAYDCDGYTMPQAEGYANQQGSLGPVGATQGFAGAYGVYAFEDVFSSCRDPDPLINDAMVLEIADEIAANVQYLPDKESSGKYSLDKNHPIHCVWRDLNRGHCSWRCRWWENGKRLSKNFNVKRFGEREAMWMAIAMKIRNSTPVERFQLLKEQREAVRNYCELLRQNAGGAVHDAGVEAAGAIALPSVGIAPRKTRSPLNSTKSTQKANWARIAWTYIMVPERRAGGSSVVCRLCAKTTKCSRSRNLQQAHIMHLIRMHKNPWKQYLDEEGLTKMCRSALDALYQQRGFTANSEWKLRPGLTPPEPGFDYTAAEVESDLE